MRYTFDVAPRYTPGSPAMVDQDTAERVAAEERRAYEISLEGVYGEEAQRKAQLMGLRGIAEQRRERGSGKNHVWEVVDLCTGEVYDRPVPEAMTKLGYEQFRYLSKDARETIDANPPTGQGDWHRGWFKQVRYDRFEMFSPKLRDPRSV